ncbi:3-oxoacyl-ACP synthase III family protein, partial [Streptomyces sp. YS-3]
MICGIGACLPQRSVSNQELARRLHIPADTIHDLTGIRRRRIAEPGTSTGDLAVLAGQAALTSAATASDFLLLATSTPDRPIPATAPEVAHRLNLGDIPALDVGAGCPGFLYALTLARALITSGICSRPLVIGADVLSSVLDPLDPTTSMVFGDGAGAVLLGQGPSTQPGAICATDLGSDGSGSDLITILAGGSRHPLRDEQPLPP